MASLYQFIDTCVKEAGLRDLAIVYLVLIGPPIGLFCAWRSQRGSTNPDHRKGAKIFFSLSTLFAVLAGWFLVFHGRELFARSLEVGRGVFITGLACLAALPFCWLGSQIRTAFTIRSRKSIVSSLLGVGIVAVLAAWAFAHLSSVIAYGGAAFVSLGVAIGLFGRFLVPDID